MNINRIGVWSFRIILLIGMIVAGLLDKDGLVAVMSVGLVWSFILYDNEE